MIDRLADAGIPIDGCCRVLGVARQHYYRVKRKPLTQSELRRQWLTGLIRRATTGTIQPPRCLADNKVPSVQLASVAAVSNVRWLRLWSGARELKRLLHR